MPYGPIVAGLMIQAGAIMIQAGIERAVPELAKALDSPEIEDAINNLDIKKTLTKLLVEATHHKRLKR
jgi:hypothetical protein